MIFTLDIAQLEQGIAQEANRLLGDPSLRQQVHEAMASRFHTIILKNIGDEGIDRPFYWKELSPRYAKRVGRTHATLEVTGNLKRSIDHDSNPEFGIVWQDDGQAPYGPAHQFGIGKMPYRPFFPITKSGLTDYATAEVVDAASEALSDALQSPYDR